MVAMMNRPRPVLPDYTGANLAAVLPAFLAPPGERPAWVPEPARSAGQVVIFVVDGLGWLQLQDRLALAPHLAGMNGGSMTAAVPSTTAVALTTLTVGVPPAVHGVVGYRVAVEGPTGPEVMNVLRWKTVSGDARSFVPPRQFQPVPPFQGRNVPVVTKAEFSGTGFTDAHQWDAPVAGWYLPSSIAVETGRLVAAGEPLVYAYYEGVDKIAHITGLGAHYDAELVALDRLVGDLLDALPPDAALVVTADHGQVDVGTRAAPLDPALRKLAGQISGEGRFRWLHAPPGSGPGGLRLLADAAGERYGDEAWVVTCDQMEAEGWFGGPLSPTVRARLGDVALIPFTPVAYLDPEDGGEARLVCRHGSLTPEEMLVPMVAAPGRLGAYG
jgi:hypothetical protein